ncbi:MAG: hypothetical protein FD130_1209, partial [Halothiobacillaceae bacterium]
KNGATQGVPLVMINSTAIYGFDPAAYANALNLP